MNLSFDSLAGESIIHRAQDKNGTVTQFPDRDEGVYRGGEGQA